MTAELLTLAIATTTVYEALSGVTAMHLNSPWLASQEAESDAMPGFCRPTKRDTLPTKPSASFGPGKAFYGPIKLPNGATIRLVCLQDNAKRPNNVWKPDGAAAAPEEIKTCLDLSHEPIPKSLRTLFLKVAVAGKNVDSYTYKIETAHFSSLAVFSPYSDWNDLTDRAVFFAPKTLRTTDIRIGVATGDYKPIGTVKVGDKASASGVSLVSLKSSQHRDGGWNYDVKVSYPRRYAKMDVDLEAWTPKGKQLTVVGQDDGATIDKKGRSTCWFRLSADSDAKPSRFRICVRPYDWATFKGIHLYPNSRKKY